MAKIIEELTPDNLRCGWGSCPSVFALDDGDLLVVGKKLTKELVEQIAHKVADDEFAVRIGSEYFINISKTNKSDE